MGAENLLAFNHFLNIILFLFFKFFCEGEACRSYREDLLPTLACVYASISLQPNDGIGKVFTLQHNHLSCQCT